MLQPGLMGAFSVRNMLATGTTSAGGILSRVFRPAAAVAATSMTGNTANGYNGGNGGMGTFNGAGQVRGMAKKAGKRKKDYRVRMIKYALNHPLTPRPLKFGAMRMLRHWTIHRAWHLYQRQVRTERDQELERQYNYMRDACEELKKTDLRLFRIATSRKGTGYFPMELRIPTDTPPKGGWDHAWTRPVQRG